MYEEKEKYQIQDFEKVKFSIQGNIIEITHIRKKNNDIKIKVLKNHKYLDLDTGEIKDMQIYKSRIEMAVSLKRTFRKLRQIINTNVIDPEKSHFITLTYVENMMDQKKLYKDFKNFFKQFRKYCKKRGYEKIEYISVVEPQSRGAWHCHVIVIYKKKRPYIERSIIEKLWGYGFVHIRKVDSVDDLGSYLTAYLCDVEVSELQEDFYNENAYKSVKNMIHLRVVGEEGNYKAYVKGQRLSYYPVNFNLYRRSKGIIEPVEEEMTYEEAMKKVSKLIGIGSKTFEKSYYITDEDSNIVNVITKENYNIKRKIKKERF